MAEHIIPSLNDVVHHQSNELWNARALLAVLIDAWPVDQQNEKRRVIRIVQERLDAIQKSLDPYI